MLFSRLLLCGRATADLNLNREPGSYCNLLCLSPALARVKGLSMAKQRSWSGTGGSDRDPAERMDGGRRVGGKLSCASEAGFLWDIGPSLMTMPFILNDLFEAAGHDINDYLELTPLNPICRYFFPDGKVMNAWSNHHHFQIELARIEKDHGESLDNFMRYAQGIYDLASEAYLFPSSRRGSRLRLLKYLHHLPKILTWRTMAK